MSLPTTVSILSILYFSSSLIFPTLTNIQHFTTQSKYEEEEGFILSFNTTLLAEVQESTWLGIASAVISVICFIIGKYLSMSIGKDIGAILFHSTFHVLYKSFMLKHILDRTVLPSSASTLLNSISILAEVSLIPN